MLFEEERALQAELVANQVTPEERKEALVARLKAYHAQTVPVLQHYGAGKAVGVDANRSLDAVWADIDAATVF